jgi:Electron transfer DM13
VGWWLFRPERLWVNRTVNESFPAASDQAAAKPASAATRAPETPAPAEPAVPSPLASGRFHGVAHETQGVATIYELPDGQRILRFTEFATSNGPDVRVYLVAADDATDNDTVTRAGFIEVTPIKGNQGDQNYTLPADLDLTRYRAVTIWCHRFGVNFGTAPLTSEAA